MDRVVAARRRMVVVGVSLIAAAVFFAYFGSLPADFVWDDQYLIVENRRIKDISGAAVLFSEDIGAGAFTAFRSYRPLQLLTYAIDFRLYGLDPAGFRFTNIVLHGLVAAAAFCFFARAAGNMRLAFFAALVYALHPVHTEAVTYVSGRADSLAALFVLLAALCFVRAQGPASRTLGITCVLAFAAGLYSKENSVIFPVLAAAYAWVYRARVNRVLLVCLIAVTAAYVAQRTFSLHQPFVAGASWQTLAGRIPLFFAALPAYLRLVFLPVELHMAYPFRTYAVWDSSAVAGYVVFAALAALAVLLRDKNREASFGILWFLAALVPVSNIMPTNESFMMEHWLYLPGIGLSLAVASAVFRLVRPVPAACALSVCALFLGVAVVRQNAYWRDDGTLYRRILEFDPDSPRVLNNYCIVLTNQREFERALPVCARNAAVSPRSAYARVNLGNLYRANGETAEAMRHYEAAAALDPRSYSAYLNMGVLFAAQGRHDDAVIAFKRAAGLNPQDGSAWYNLGNAYRESGRCSEAVRAYRAALERDPHGVHAGACRKNLALLEAAAVPVGKNKE